MTEANWNLIVKFTKKHWPFNTEHLLVSSRLQEDLGIKGDDADIFMNEFAQEFDVDIKNLDLSNYFNGYSDDLFASLVRFFKPKSGKIKKSLTLGDLKEAIERGKLDDNDIMDN